MVKLVHDTVGERMYETGVSLGVLFVQERDGKYKDGVAWNGLTSAEENPTGADINDIYADDIKYLGIQGAEKFEGTIAAYYSPKEFDQCDGSIEIAKGVNIHQQARKSFGFAFISKIGNDTEGITHGRKLHIWYGCRAKPTQRSYQTVGESPEPANPSWSVSSTPTNVPGVGNTPTSVLTVNELEVGKDKFQALLDVVYGSDTKDSNLPSPDDVVAITA